MNAHTTRIDRRDATRAPRVLAVLAATLLGTSAAHAAESYTLWDNFNNQTQFNAAL